MYIGDFNPGDTIDFDFTTRNSSGVPTTLAGTPAVSVYKGNSTTESTAGVTLTVDYDSRTGLNHVRITLASDGTFYAAASDFRVVITTGTVGGSSVVGEVIFAFSIQNRSALRPATAGRTVVVDAAGLVDANVVKVGPSGSGTAQVAGVLPTLGATLSTAPVSGSIEEALLNALQMSARRGTAQAGSSSTITLDSGASANDHVYRDFAIYLTGGTGAGQYRTGIAYVGSTKILTVDRAWNTIPDATTTFVILRKPSVNVSMLNNLTVAGVTAVNPNIGTTQPINFTGTGASALVKGDTIDIAGVLINTASAQLGVSVVSYASGQAPLQPTVAGRTLDVSTGGEAGIDWANIGTPGSTVNLSATSIATLTNDPSGVTTLLARLTATRAGYIDNLSAGPVAQASALTTAQADLDDIQTRLPASLIGGRMSSDVEAVNNQTNGVSAFARALAAITEGTVGNGSTTTSIVTSSLSPAAAAIDQFKGQIVCFDEATSTVALRGQKTDITGSTAGGILTVTALTTAPSSGDTFTIQ